MLEAERVIWKLRKATIAAAEKGMSPEQAVILERFRHKSSLTSDEIGEILKVSLRQARALCARWMDAKFLATRDPSKRARRYGLHRFYMKYSLWEVCEFFSANAY